MADNRNEKAAGARSAYSIDLSNFTERLTALYSHWNLNNSELWGSSDVLSVSTPSPWEDLRYLKSSALNIWLLGYEFPDTIMVFMKKQIHFLCSQKKVSLLDVVKKPAMEAVGAEVVMHVKTKNDDGSALMESIFREVRAQSKADGKESSVVGYFAREVPEGKLSELWAEKLESANFQLIDVANGMSDLFAVKDKQELVNVKKAAFLTTNVMNNIVVPKLKNVIGEKKKVTHSALMYETEKAILDPSKAGAELQAVDVDICYPPILQSGGEFDLKSSAITTHELLKYDSASVIICAIGSRYKCYCSNIARTFLIDPNPLQSKSYGVLLEAHEAAISALKPGNKISDVYQAALSVVNTEGPELVLNLTKSAGTGIGLEFREFGMSLNGKNDRLVKEGMVFNVCLGFQNLQYQTSSSNKQMFSLLHADTVVVDKDRAEVVTGKTLSL